jgi:hypothetical protein
MMDDYIAHRERTREPFMLINSLCSLLRSPRFQLVTWRIKNQNSKRQAKLKPTIVPLIC